MSGGAKAATDSFAQLKAWAKKYPLGNLALATGTASKFWALDVDLDHDGLESLRQLEEEFGPLPVTVKVQTGGGGWHYYFSESQEIRNRAGLLPGLDVRGDAGYVLAAGSSHASGNDYTWADGRALGEVEIAEAPTWLVELVVGRKKDRATDLSADGEAISEGTRNATLASIGGSMRRRGMSEDAIAVALLKENENRCNPPLDEDEVRRIAHSIGRYEPEHSHDDRLQLAGLAQLPESPDLRSLEDALRNLGGLLDGGDLLQRETTVEAAVSCLAEKGLTLQVARRLVTVALKPSRKTSPADEPNTLFTNPAPWAEPVDGVHLLDELSATVRRFVVLPNSAADAIALWLVFAHAHDAFQISPLLGITSPTMRCGKSTLLELLLDLVPRGLAASNVSPAALFRAVDLFNPTLIIDEADTFMRSDSDYINILNSSWKRSMASVIRCVGDNYTPTPFSTWGPKVIALIGQLPPTLEDRSIEIRLERRLPGEEIERLRPDRAAEFLESLKRKTWTWAQARMKELSGADPDVPKVLDDRAQDNWRGLLAIADLVGGDWPERARMAALTLDEAGLGREEALRIQLLEDLRNIFEEKSTNVYTDGKPVTRVSSSNIVRELQNREDRPWADYKAGRGLTAAELARFLRPFGIRPRPMHLPGSKTARGYEAADFVEVFERYLKPETDS